MPGWTGRTSGLSRRGCGSFGGARAFRAQPASPRKTARGGKNLLGRDELGFSPFVSGNAIRDFGFPGCLHLWMRLTFDRLQQLLGELRSLFERERLSLLRKLVEQGGHRVAPAGCMTPWTDLGTGKVPLSSRNQCRCRREIDQGYSRQDALRALD